MYNWVKEGFLAQGVFVSQQGEERRGEDIFVLIFSLSTFLACLNTEALKQMSDFDKGRPEENNWLDS